MWKDTWRHGTRPLHIQTRDFLMPMGRGGSLVNVKEERNSESESAPSSRATKSRRGEEPQEADGTTKKTAQCSSCQQGPQDEDVDLKSKSKRKAGITW